MIKKTLEAIFQCSGWLLLLGAFIVTYDVIVRKIFNISLSGADEISGYIFAISTSFAYSYALLSRSNIRIDFIYNLLPVTVQRIMDVISMILVSLLFMVICYYAYHIVVDALTYNSKSVTPLQVPLIIPQSIWFLGLVLTLTISLYLSIISTIALLKKDYKKVQEKVGMPNLEEEIKAEANIKGK